MKPVVGPLFVNMQLDIPPTTESWLRIWEAGVALFELCVKNHLGGIFNGLGTFYAGHSMRTPMRTYLLTTTGANKQISISLGY